MIKTSCCTLTILLCFMLGSSCSTKEDFSTAESIAVNWELLTNFTDQKDVFEARLTITNNSDFLLTENNWALFFNMAPRPILENKTPQPALLHHINGD